MKKSLLTLGAVLSLSGCRSPECDPRLPSGALDRAPKTAQVQQPLSTVPETQTPEYWQARWREQAMQWWGVDVDQQPPSLGKILDGAPTSLRAQSQSSSAPEFDYDFSSKWKVDKIVGKAGPGRVHFVVISEGFLKTGRLHFQERAQDIATALLAEKPYDRYRDAIAVWSAFAPSPVRGVSCDDDQGTEKITHFGTSFPIACLNAKYGTQFSDRFMLVTSLAKVQAFIRYLQTQTGGERVVPLFFADSDKYGGSAAPYASASTGSSDAVMVHEWGHSFGGLMDEYVAPGDPCLLFQGLGPNISFGVSKREHVKWAHWIDASTPVPTPVTDEFKGKTGFFLGAANCPKILYKPARTCKMEDNSSPFCQVCNEQVILKIFETARPAQSEVLVQKLAGTKNSYRFDVATLSSGMKVRWWVDRKLVQESAEKTALEMDLSKGEHEIAAQVHDETAEVRKNRCDLAQTVVAHVKAE